MFKKPFWKKKKAKGSDDSAPLYSATRSKGTKFIGLAPNPIKYYIDVSIVCHPVTKRCKNGKKITGNIQYMLMERIDGIEQALAEKYKTKVNFYSKIVDHA